jgi:toxin ParE1/3/4
MTFHVVYMRRAEADIREIAGYLHVRFGFPVAMRFLVEIRAYCAGFSEFPERGIARNDIQPGLRVVAYKRHASIGFVIRENRVIILRVWNKGRKTKL